MTLNTWKARNEWTDVGGGQDKFYYWFRIYKADQLTVYLYPASAQSADRLPSDALDILSEGLYTVHPDTVGDVNGGYITLNTPTLAGDKVTIVSNIPTSRTTNYVDNGDFLEDTLDEDIDRNVSLIKQDVSKRRALNFPESLQLAENIIVEPPVAGKFLKWNGDGTKVISSDPAEDPTGFVTEVSGDGVTPVGDARFITGVVDLIDAHRVDNSDASHPKILGQVVMVTENAVGSADNVCLASQFMVGSNVGSSADMNGALFVLTRLAGNANTSGVVTLEVTGTSLSGYVKTFEGGHSTPDNGQISEVCFLSWDHAQTRWILLYSTGFPLIPNDHIVNSMIDAGAVRQNQIAEDQIQPRHMDHTSEQEDNMSRRVLQTSGKFSMTGATISNSQLFGIGTSVAYGGLGIADVTIDMDDDDYIVTTEISDNGATGSILMPHIEVVAKTTTGFSLVCYRWNAGYTAVELFDPAIVSFVVHGVKSHLTP